MGEDRIATPEQPLGRYGAEYRLALVAAGSAIGIVAFLASRDMPSWPGLGLFAGILGAGWLTLLALHGRAAENRQRRVEGLRRARDFAERLVIYDRETGFYADWYFRLRLQEELVRSQRFGHSCALLLVEATEARLSGERERALFESMATAFRDTDLVAHLGSLRFVVLLPNVDPESAILARIRLVERLPPGAVEAGIASYPKDGKDWRELLGAAGASSTDFYGSPSRVWNPDSAARLARWSDELPA